MSKARQLAQKPSQPTGRKNLVINGAMTVWQRGTASTAVTSAFLADRFKDIESSDGAMTHEQSTDAPDGFAYSLELNVTTADTSLGTTQYAEIDYKVEAQDCQHFNYGSNAAQPVTLSFWVKSSKTGTYCIMFLKHDSTRYHYVKEYTIDTANTWEKKTITIEPDSNIKASGGAIANDNGEGVRVIWCLAMGSTYSAATDGVWSSDTNDYATSNQVNWLDNTSNNFYLTGVQLEVGSTATEFEHRSYGEELALCQRYYYRWEQANSGVTAHALHVIGMYTSTRGFFGMSTPVPMRTSPSVSEIGSLTLTAPNLGSAGTVSGLSVYAHDDNNSRFSIDTTVSGGTANVYRSIKAVTNIGI